MKSIVLNFNKPLLTVKGTPTAQVLSDLFADYLSSEVKGDSVKLYSYAVALAAGETIAVDKSDFKLLQDLIINSDRLVVLLRAQLLEVFDNPEGEAVSLKTKTVLTNESGKKYQTTE